MIELASEFLGILKQEWILHFHQYFVVEKRRMALFSNSIELHKDLRATSDSFHHKKKKPATDLCKSNQSKTSGRKLF